jgi:hypothetical protein
VCEASFAEDASLEGPLVPHNPGESIPLTCTFRLDETSAPVMVIRPSLATVSVNCEDAGGAVLPPIYPLPPAVGIPNDVITVNPGDELAFPLDLADFFRPEVLNASDGPYACTCTFSSLYQDPDLVDGVCTSPDFCVELDPVAVTSGPVEVIIEGDPVLNVRRVDLKPGECPNTLSRSSKGVFDVAIPGRPDFDVRQVDLASVRIARADGLPIDGSTGDPASVAPNEGPPGPHSTIEDVATPFEGPFCGCSEEAGDGIPDLVLRFQTEELVDVLALDPLPSGDPLPLVVSGRLLDGTPFESASDCAKLVPPEKKSRKRASLDGPSDRGAVAPPDGTLAAGGTQPFERASGGAGLLLLGALLGLRPMRHGARGAALLALGAWLWLGATTPAAAQVALCPAGAPDRDLDGFCDAQETAGIVLFDGRRIAPTNPGAPDLFVAIVRLNPACSPTADPTCIPGDGAALDLISAPKASGGLGIAVHEIAAAQIGPNREVSPDSAQKAVRVTESAILKTEDLGSCNWGTPNGFDDCVIYTQRILSYVSGVCAGKSSCRLSTGEEGIAAVVRRYVKHTLNHEIGHSLQLTALYSSRLGGNHQKVGAGVLMEKSSVYTDKGGRVTWYIATAFGGADQGDAVLKLPF